jgi:hypothetical protein
MCPANDWSRSQLIRESIQNMKSTALQPEQWNVDGIPLVEWMEWALNYADRIDPVTPLRKVTSKVQLDAVGPNGPAGRT